MTLSTVKRYDGSQTSLRGATATVIGAGVAGLVAARVLADQFETVVVLDRDSLVDTPVARAGVPQGRHPHALLEAGRATLSDLCPGYGAALVRAGGVVTDFNGDVQFYSGDGFLASGSRRMETISATRPLLEQVLRHHVVGHDRVDLRDEWRVVDYVTDHGGERVSGVDVRQRDETSRLAADLVVDATGRASRTPAWLDNHGYTSPPVEEVHIDLVYSTAFLDRPPGDRRTVLVPAIAPRTRGGMVAPVEDQRWIVTLHGVHGDRPPAARPAFEAFAKTLPTTVVADILDGHSWIETDTARYPFPSNRRHRYDELDTFPEGLLVVGDAIASYNPMYAQGMSVAALEALVLHHTLVDGGLDGLAERYFERVAPVVDIAWLLAVGNDFGFEETTGPKPTGSALIGRYFDRLVDRAQTDGTLAEAFRRVLAMVEPPISLLRPGIVWRVLKPTRHRRLR